MAKYPHLKVSATHKRLPSLGPEEVRLIIEAAEKVKDEDWSAMVRYATVIFAICSGLRSKELRFCNVNDIHINEGTWTVDVLHPRAKASTERRGKHRYIRARTRSSPVTS